MNLPGEVLDERLPLVPAPRVELHQNVAVIEVSDSSQLVELASNPKIRRHLLGRLSDTVALIDPGHVEALSKVLLTEGHTPKFVTGVSS